MTARDIFAKHLTDAELRAAGTWDVYQVELQVRDKLIGGVPKDPDTIANWIRSRMDLDDRALMELANETATKMEAEGGQRPTGDALVDAVAREMEGGNGFKLVDGQLVYEGRCAKAALKEGANVAYPGTDWPSKTRVASGFRKGLMAALAERVFVDDLYIPLGVTAPSGTEQRIKHVKTAQGPRAAINVVDFVDRPTLRFTVRALKTTKGESFLTWPEWLRIWEAAQHIGIGADRARSDGKFDLVQFEAV